MNNRDFAKTQIDALPDSAVDRVVEFISYQLFILGQKTGSAPRGDAPTDSKTKTRAEIWAELNAVIASMDELPAFENFPRADFGRDLINFGEVQ